MCLLIVVFLEFLSEYLLQSSRFMIDVGSFITIVVTNEASEYAGFFEWVILVLLILIPKVLD